MAAPVRELMYLTAPVAVVVDGEGEVPADLTQVTVKGFASVNSPADRSGDVVPPQEFRIPQFMANPTLLVNHRFWSDEYGNQVAVGRPLEMYAAKLTDLGDRDQKNWGVVSLEDGTLINRYPRAKIPNLSAGAEGLFVVVQVTQPDVVSRVRAGELSAFSWRGLTNVEYRVNPSTNLTQRVFRDIDLFEISLVNIPDNPDATFVIGKTVDGKFVSELKLDEPLAVYMVSLDKGRFESLAMAKAYADRHGLSFEHMKETESDYQLFQQTDKKFDLEKLAAVKMTDGVRVVAGPLLDVSPEAAGWRAAKVSAEDAKQLEAAKSAAVVPVIERAGVQGPRSVLEILKSFALTQSGV